MPVVVVALALWLAACSGAPQAPGVTATRVLELSGLQPLANAVGLSPDGSLVVTGDFEADLIAREVPSGTERWKVRVKPRREQRRIDGVFFSPDGSLIVTTGHEAQTTEVWDAATRRSPGKDRSRPGAGRRSPCEPRPRCRAGSRRCRPSRSR